MKAHPLRSTAPRRQLPAILAVAGLHVLAIMALLSLRGGLDRGRPAGPPQALLVSLWFGAREPERPAELRPQDPAAARRAPNSDSRLPVQAPAPLTEPAPGPAKAIDAETPAATSSASLPVSQAITVLPPPVAPAASAPLNLTLPTGPSAPWRQRHPARDDSRANSAPRTLESRLATAMEGLDGRTTQEVMAGGSLRLRRGADCVVAHPNRAESLEPFNASVMPKPRQVEKC